MPSKAPLGEAGLYKDSGLWPVLALFFTQHPPASKLGQAAVIANIIKGPHAGA